MALPDPITLKNASAASMALTRRLPIPNGSRYVHTGATPSWTCHVEARSLFVTPKKGDKYNRNIITFGMTRVDADDIPHTASVALSVVRPFAVDITDADMNDLWAMLAEFQIVSAGDIFTRWKRGEV